MVSSKEDKKLRIEDFRGLYSRGSVDEVPTDHAQDCLNLYFTSSGHIKTRDGLISSLALGFSGGVRRFFLMTATPPNDLETNAASNPNLLMLGIDGKFYIDTAATPFLTVSGATDFAALNINNRTYLAPNSGIGASRLMKLQIVNGFTGAVRNAAGLAPAVTSDRLLAATQSGTAGVVSAGLHKIAVIFETDTGFWTPPGPKVNVSCTPTAAKPCVLSTSAAHGMISGESHTIYGGTGNWSTLNDTWHITKVDDTHFSIPIDTTGLGAVTGTFTIDSAFTPATVTVDGTHKISLTSVTLAPSGAGVVKRLFLATRAGENEFFFVPEKVGSTAIIPDNTTTTATLDFEDTDLVASADYLFDILEVIPSGGSLTKYRGRLILAGQQPDEERVILSNIDDPETFNYVNGYIQVQTERDGNIVVNCYVLRDTLYLSKFVGIFATEDNGGNPSTWAVTVVDGAVGSYNHGKSSFTVSQDAPDTGDIILLASRSGLYLFDGVIRRPELSWKIQNLWLRINFAAFHRVTVTHDIWNHLVYISLPLDTATEPNYLLVGDYTDGRDAEHIRWTPWALHKNPTCIGMSYFGTDLKYRLRVGSIDANTVKVYGLSSTATDDDGTTIESFYTPGPLFIGQGGAPDTGGVNTFKQLNFRVGGTAGAKLMLALTDVGGAGTVYPPELTLAVAPRYDLQRGINFVNEKMNLKVGIYSANSKTPTKGDYFVLDRIDVWGQCIWNSRPTV